MDPLASAHHTSMRNFDPATLNTTSSPLTARRAFSSMSGRVGGMTGVSSRSWHPSPFASDDEAGSTTAAEEPNFFKEEKKNRIKMEIARRRQQIEENACLHEELTRLARLRESAEMGNSSTTNAGVMGSSTVGPNAIHVPSSSVMHPSGVVGSDMVGHSGASVLKSVDEILRDGSDHYRTSTLHNSDPFGSSSLGAGVGGFDYNQLNTTDLDYSGHLSGQHLAPGRRSAPLANTFNDHNAGVDPYGKYSSSRSSAFK